MDRLKTWLYFKGKELEDQLWTIKRCDRVEGLLVRYEIPYIIRKKIIQCCVEWSKIDGLRSLDFAIVKEELWEMYGDNVRADTLLKDWQLRSITKGGPEAIFAASVWL